MPNDPGDPYGWIQQDANIAANSRAQQQIREQEARAGYAHQLAHQPADGQARLRATSVRLTITPRLWFRIIVLGVFGAILIVIGLSTKLIMLLLIGLVLVLLVALIPILARVSRLFA